MTVNHKLIAHLRGLTPQDLRGAMSVMAEEDPQGMREFIEQDPRHLMMYLGYALEWFHAQAFEEALAFDEYMWLAPRGSGKSTALAVVLPAWLAIARPSRMAPQFRRLFPAAPAVIGPHNIRMAITSNSSEKAASLLFQIKKIITSPELAKLFGTLEGDRWQDIRSDTALRTSDHRECTLNALGIGTKITGGHYDVVFADDWVTEENARTDLMRRRMSDFWSMTMKGTLEPWARTIVTGTRYHPLDWYGEIFGWQQAGLWKKITRTPALLDNGQSYWPAMYTVKELTRRREQMGTVAFLAQYQNLVDQMRGGFFKQEWVENWQEWDKLPADDRGKATTVITCDPGIAEGKKADFTAIAVISYIAPYFYIRRIARGQWTMQEIMAQLKALYDVYKPQLVGIEVVAGQKWLYQELQRTTRMPLRPLDPTAQRVGDKEARGNYVRNFFEQMRVFTELPTKENGTQRWREEALIFPHSDSPGWDDTVDAVVWGLILFTKTRTRAYKLEGRRHI